MTKTEALYKFFNSFGLTAYPSNSVPDDTVFPWLTYEPTIGNFGDEQLSITVNLWYHTDSEAIPNKKVDDISEAIGMGGVTVPYDDGMIWITRGTPFCQSLSDENDASIKRRMLNVNLEYL